MEKYKCKECFDTGCACGGIGLSCHGCCNCVAGEKARLRRTEALKEIKVLDQIILGTECSKV